MHETQVAHEHVCGFVANLCFVNVVLMFNPYLVLKTEISYLPSINVCHVLKLSIVSYLSSDYY